MNNPEDRMQPIGEKYAAVLSRMLALAEGMPPVDKDHVLREGRPQIRALVEGMIEAHLEEGSGLRNAEAILELRDLARRGRSTLILSEHYSNADLPALIYFLSRLGPDGREAADAIVAMAGIKLLEESPFLRVMTEAYARIVIYPSRSLEIIRRRIKEPRELVHEMVRSNSINRAAMKALARVRAEGRTVLVYPAGTRFRPWDPDTKRGVREVASYLKTFDAMVLIAINGNILRINEAGEMSADLITRDRLVMTASPVIPCAEFRSAVREGSGFRDDRKQMVVDEVMRRLDELHAQAEKDRPGGASRPSAG
jgi:1-acyl-sn-glycerol-3-phosphate acyltransferase